MVIKKLPSLYFDNRVENKENSYTGVKFVFLSRTTYFIVDYSSMVEKQLRSCFSCGQLTVKFLMKLTYLRLRSQKISLKTFNRYVRMNRMKKQYFSKW